MSVFSELRHFLIAGVSIKSSRYPLEKLSGSARIDRLF